jgi:apolipoprotein N-acyltransferase
VSAAVETLRRATDGLVLASARRRLLAAALAGGAGSLALPPIGLVPALVLGFAPLVLVLDGARTEDTRRARWTGAFAAGWAFGFAWFAASLWWVGEAFLVDAAAFAWAMPLGVVGLPALLAFFTGFGTLAAVATWGAGPWRALGLAATLALSEWLRGWVFTGFPWNAFGYALTASDAGMQAASLVGIEGLTALAVFAGAAPAVLFDPPTAGRARFAVPALALALVAAQHGFGALRLAEATDATVPGVRLRIVQPNLTQAERRDVSRHIDVLERYLRLTSAAYDGGAPTHVIWPESALPFSTENAPALVQRITRALPQGAVLIAGMQRPEEGDTGRVFNTLQVLDRDGRILARYDKTHLVPFGEYLPFPAVMRRIGLEPLTQVFAFAPGALRRPIETPGAPPFGPLICYEVIFSGEVAGDAERPGWLVNISDDSWFGSSLGPRQHLHQARVRAAEQGLPLVRATTTGISAIIDAYGRVRVSAGLGAEYTLDGVLPQALEPTLYTQARGALILFLLTAAALLFAITRWSTLFLGGSRN